MQTIAIFLLLLFTLASLDTPAEAQPQAPVLDATSLGDRISLDRDWLFHPGDDPRWSDPAFDDRDWRQVDLHKNLATYGVPPDTTYGWLRLHLRLKPSATAPPVFGVIRSYGGYRVFANGQPLGGVGNMDQHFLYDVDALRQYTLPENILRPAAPDGTVEVILALRCSLQIPTYNLSRPTAPFLSGHLYLGTARALAEADISAVVLSVVPLGANIVPSVVVAFFALVLFLAVRSHREYLLLALLELFGAAGTIYDLYFWIAPFTATAICVEAILLFAATFSTLAFLRELIGDRYRRVYLLLLVCLTLNSLMIPLWAYSVIAFFNAYGDVINWTYNVVVLLVLLHARRKANPGLRRDLLIVLLGVAAEVTSHSFELVSTLYDAFGLAPPAILEHLDFKVGPFTFRIETFADIVFTLSLLLFLVDRTVRIARERNLAAAEVEAAHTVQQLLLSRSSVPTPGFTIERVYRPASEVGGDFFLLSSSPADGSLLAVIGDVSGKGLAAAMNVSMILGVLQNEPSRSPAEVLRNLNRCLLAQGAAGFTTACCVHFTPAGQFTLANAGHIAPYLAGSEIETQPSLPLGLDHENDYPLTSGRLLPGQHMTLLTDGIPEARAGNGRLLGFDQLPTLTCAQANQIADTAQTFGQEDDITILTIALQPA